MIRENKNKKGRKMKMIQNTCGDMVEEAKIISYYKEHGAQRKTLVDRLDCIAYNWYLTEKQAYDLLKKHNLA